MHHCGKQVQLTDDQVQRADLLIRFLLSLGFSFQPARSGGARSQARLELGLLDQTLGVAVDQSLDRAVGLGELTVESIAFEPMRRGMHGVQAPLIFSYRPVSGCRAAGRPRLHTASSSNSMATSRASHRNAPWKRLRSVPQQR